MNKSELVEAIVSSTELSQNDVDKVVTCFMEVIAHALSKGEKVSLKGFGNFEVKNRKARSGVNPRTKEKIEISASKSPAFKPSSALKKVIKES